MWRVFLCILGRDLRLAMRRRTDVLTTLFFFVIVISLFPLGVGTDKQILRILGPGVVWVAALLASMLALERLFAADHEDGTLEQMLMTPQPLSLVVLAKVSAHWLLTGLPLVAIATPPHWHALISIAAAEAGKDVREDTENGCHRTVEGDLAGEGVVTGEAGLQLAPLLYRLFGILPEDHARRGEADRPAITEQQLPSQLVLEALHGPGEAGWRDIAGLAGPAEMERTGQVPEDFQFLNIHRCWDGITGFVCCS